MHSRATDRRSASKCQGKCPDQTLDQAFGLSEVLVAVSTSRLSCKSAGKTRTLMPVWDSSGESRIKYQDSPDDSRTGVNIHAFPALNLAAARLRYIAGTAWSTKRYLNIELLKDQQMRGAITA